MHFMNLKNNKMLNRYFFISTTKRELSGYDQESVYRQSLQDDLSNITLAYFCIFSLQQICIISNI